MTAHPHSPAESPLIHRFHAHWVRRLDSLRETASHMVRRHFPRFSPDEILNETYVKMRRRLQRAVEAPLDWSLLPGYIYVTMRNVLNDFLRETQQQKSLRRRYAQLAIPDTDATGSVAGGRTTRQIENWRKGFRSAMREAWERASLSPSEKQLLAVWLSADSRRRVALDLLGLQHATRNEQQRFYDQRLFQIKRKLQSAFHPLQEWVEQMDQTVVGATLTEFLAEQLADSSLETVG